MSIDVAFDQIIRAARSQGGVEPVPVRCERDAPEVEISGLEGRTIARDREVLQIRDRRARHGVNDGSPCGESAFRVRVTRLEHGECRTASVGREPRPAWNAGERFPWACPK